MFTINNTSLLEGSDTYTIESGFTVNRDTAKTGHTFAGWSGDNKETNAKYSGKTINIPVGTYGDIDLYATWTTNEFTLTFVTNGGNKISAETHKYGEEIELPTPTKDGYSFNGWYKDGNLSVPVDDPFIMPAENTTIYADWTANQYKITFNTNDGTWTNPNITDPYQMTFDYKESLSGLPTEADISRKGYKFVGWYKDANGTIAISDEMDVIGGFTAYAKWDIISYNIVLSGLENATYNGSTSFTYTINNPTFTLNTPTKEGYSFDGWTSADIEYNSQTNVYNVLETSIGKDITITANWTVKKYTITFNTNGGTTIDSITIDYGDELIAPANPTKSGYTFGGWYEDSQFQTEFHFDDYPSMPARSITLFAYWSKGEFTITFDSNDGSSVPSIKAKYEDTISKPTDPTKTGYTFAGWYENEELSGNQYEFNKMPAKNFTLYAKWSAIKYTITYYDFNINEPENVNSTIELKTYTIEDEIVLPTPTKAGYVFANWGDYEVATNGKLESPISNNNQTFTIKKGSYGDIKIEIGWSLEPDYTISYDFNGWSYGEGVVYTTKYNIESPTFSLTKPTRLGYEFTGWSGTGLDGENNMEVTIPKGSTGNREYVAHWKAIEYTITYVVGDGQIDENAPKKYTIEQEVSIPNATNTNADFSGWSVTNSIANGPVFNGKNITIPVGTYGNLTFTASYGSLISVELVSSPTEGNENVYNGSPYTVTTIVKLNNEVIDITSDQYKDKIKINYSYYNTSLGGEPTSNGAVNAGNYKVTASVELSGGYVLEKEPNEATLVVKQATPTINFTAPENPQYEHIIESVINNSTVTLNGVTLPNGTVETITISSKSSTVSTKYEDGTDYNGSANSNVIQTPVVISVTHNNANYEQATSIIKNIAVNAVAHNGNGTYYSTIGRSMSIVTAGTVYVIPSLGIDVPINGSVTIPSGVTLALPYENTTTYGEVSGNNVNNPHADTIASNRMTNVVVNNSTLTNNGSIIIGGIINGGGGGYESGYSTGKYTQITLNSSTIENIGTIKNYGYIDENDNLSKINNVGTIYTPFVVVEHRGGSSFMGIYISGMDAAPFNRFYLPNIKTTMITNYGASLYGMADLFANNQHNLTNIGLFGTSSSFLIQMNSGTVIESKFVNSAQLDIYGSVNLKSMSITLETGLPWPLNKVTLSTSDVLFPISWYYDIELHPFKNGDNSSVNFGSQDIKLLPGSSLHIHEGVTVTAGTIAIYDTSFNDVIVNAPSAYPSSSNADLTVNGTLNVAKIGGNVNTSYSTGKLTISSSSSVSSNEIIAASSSGATYKPWDFNLRLKLYNGSGPNTYYSNCEIGTYQSKDGGWYKVGDISIDYYSNYPSGTLDDYYVSSSTLTSTDENGVTIPSNIDTSIIPTIPDYYEFGGWYFDSSCSSGQKVSNQNIYGDVTLYAKWIPIEYNVNVVINHNTGVDSSNTSYSIPSTYKVTDGNIPIGVPINEDNTFIGWYAKLESGTYSIDVDSLDDLLAYANGKTISIYGYFEGEPTITVDYNYSEIIPNPSNALVSENKVIKQSDWDTLEYNVTHHDGQLIESNTALKKYFSHWEDQNGNRFNENTQLTTSITIKAIWYEKATICYFDANGNEITDMRIYVPIENTSEYNSFVLSTSQVNKDDTNEEDANGKFILKYTFDKWKVDTTDLVKDNNDGSYTPTSTSSIIRIIPLFTSKEYVKVSITTSNATVTVKYGNISKTSSFDVERGTTLTISVEYSKNEEKILTVNDVEFTNGETYIANGNVEINASSSGGCFASGTLITLSNGKTKPIEELTIYDEILVFNHETGSYDSISSSFIINNGFGYYPQVKLMFDDGTFIDVLFGHGFFDMNTNKYEIITTDNVTNYIGHKFYSTNNAQGISLVDYEVSIVYTGCYSLMSPVYINHFANGLLCVSDDIEGFYNVFELDENMKVIQDLKEEDINKYGLYTYEEWSEYVTIEQFYALNGQYFKIAIGKGLVTKEKIYYYIENYLSRFQ